MVPAMVALVVAGGHRLKGSESVVAVDQIDPGADAMAELGADTAPEEPATAAIPTPPQPPKPVPHSRAIDPEIVAPPDLSAEELERVEPRAPLSKLALAVPPKPKMPDDWKGTKLFQPVAPAAGLIEAKGFSVAISGIDVVRQDEICATDGKSWPCGIRARTAFRAFLRGRAVVCAVPPEGGRDLIAAECRIGKKDVGQWLVENGWARAAKGGPYAEAGDKARTGQKGIFGSAPNLSGMPSMPAASAPAPRAPGSILEEDGGVLRPADQPAPSE
ncbi:MAG: thermonuclease family protein [Mesorhizobium sp.]|nr:thermonuclease family protein [bacterium M00.F.Ca.ET.205.01.1.1]TGU48540.1 thermonuclease family protein [bacterium M00.F.Ca.ET.152.01.1.1]TGV32796.1 thermonuclease family protein [Mesorhizobium sp. M00.F.Ca.ET.186.01.1.1]TGZ40056.1 thermonuclease family protein [bacterium M00.F.Ca.ET.162.01.1.1]TJW34669.1 MAG: thermonuclease family protein [Mesorhizobium sp.]